MHDFLVLRRRNINKIYSSSFENHFKIDITSGILFEKKSLYSWYFWFLFYLLFWIEYELILKWNSNIEMKNENSLLSSSSSFFHFKKILNKKEKEFWNGQQQSIDWD
jgi:hypothetical protein